MFHCRLLALFAWRFGCMRQTPDCGDHAALNCCDDRRCRIGGWSIALYEIASVVAGAVSALVTLRYRMRTPMFLAALAFGLGCFLSAAAPIMPVMLMGRVLQGLGGGGLVAMGFVAVGVIFHRRYTARAMAAVSTFWGVSAFIGPLIGSFFVEFATWRWDFPFLECKRSFYRFGL